MGESAGKPLALSGTRITKTFPGVLALDDVNLEICSGEVHAIVGENGAGKSTLMQVFGGVYQPESGRVSVGGTPTRMLSPQDAKNRGVQLVYQELSLSPKLTVAENVFANRQPIGWFGLVRQREMERQTAEVLELYGFSASGIRPQDIVADLPIGKQQLVEIVKAVSADPKVLILDEPTSSLSSVDIAHLYSAIRTLKARGVAIVYISHHLSEVFQIADRVTVMKDGKVVATADIGDVDEAWIVKNMVGREIGDLYRAGERSAPTSEPLLAVDRLSSQASFWDVSFSVGRGEIIGVAGLVGAGRTELGRAIAGFEHITRGHVEIGGTRLPPHDPMGAMRAGVVYVTEDRRVDGLFTASSIWENLAVHEVALERTLGFLNPTSLRSKARHIIEKFTIVTPSEDQLVSRLSGGNQQKVLLAGWLSLHPKLLIVDEPTRGVDVGAKEEVYRLLRSLATEGVGIIMISSDLLEILGLSDRILVMRSGRIAGLLDRNRATEERIIALATGATRALEVM